MLIIMKVATLIHNPGAGDEKHSKDELVEMLTSKGFDCRYSSTKKRGWKDISDDTDFIVIAGGDGTVRKVCKKLLKRRVLQRRIPIAVLPVGTANNISKTLGMWSQPEINEIVRIENIRKIDVGRVDGLSKPTFFIESFGVGIFPELMHAMQDTNEESTEEAKEKIKSTLEVLHDIILKCKPKHYHIEVDEVDYSGEYILAEILNTRSVGPNLFLAPFADPGDGQLEVVLVPESQRKVFADYVRHKINGQEDPYVFDAFKARDIKMNCHPGFLHIDDELLEIEHETEIHIELIDGALKFFVPPNGNNK